VYPIKLKLQFFNTKAPFYNSDIYIIAPLYAEEFWNEDWLIDKDKFPF
jgi:hypothetical protein